MLTITHPFNDTDFPSALASFCQNRETPVKILKIIDGWNTLESRRDTILVQFYAKALKRDETPPDPVNRTVHTLEIECSLPNLSSIPNEFLGRSLIKTIHITSTIQLGERGLIQFMSSASEILYSHFLDSNYHLRKIVFTHNNRDVKWKDETSFGKILIRNQQIFEKKQQCEAILLGIAKFRKKPNGLNKDAINLIAQFVRHTELEEIEKIQSQSKSKKRRFWHFW